MIVFQFAWPPIRFEEDEQPESNTVLIARLRGEAQQHTDDIRNGSDRPTGMHHASEEIRDAAVAFRRLTEKPKPHA